MTEAIGMAGMIEAPVVFVEVQRGGPSTGIPTKTEQADLNQVYGASQGDFPRVIIAPKDTRDCFDSAVEAFNLADKYQMPVIIISDLQLSEHPETVDPEFFPAKVPIDRGEIVTEWKGGKASSSGTRSPSRAFLRACCPARPTPVHRGHRRSRRDRRAHQRRLLQPGRAPQGRREAHEENGPGAARSSRAQARRSGRRASHVDRLGFERRHDSRSVEQLNASGVSANQIQFKYLLPFHSREAIEILKGCKRTICIEVNSTGQFARHLRAETGYTVNDQILKYDGEPFEPGTVAAQVRGILKGEKHSLDVTSPKHGRSLTITCASI